MRRLIPLCVILLLSGCSGREDESPLVVRIAEQHGLAYLPLAVLQVEELLEEAFSGEELRVEWSRTGNAALIREAMLSGRLDVGFMGIPPFLIGRDRGTDWRIFTGLSEMPLGLVTLQPGYRSLEDLQDGDRIALPQPGSIQHILLAMAAETRFGDPRRFDDRLVSMGHPEGFSALLTRRGIAAHFTAPPYLAAALAEPDSALLLEGSDAFGGRYTFIVGVVAPGWGTTARERQIMETFLAALDEAMELCRKLQEDLDFGGGRLLQALAQFYGIEDSLLREQLAYPGAVFTREVHGMEQFIERMHRYGYINRKQVYPYWSELPGTESGADK